MNRGRLVRISCRFLEKGNLAKQKISSQPLATTEMNLLVFDDQAHKDNFFISIQEILPAGRNAEKITARRRKRESELPFSLFVEPAHRIYLSETSQGNFIFRLGNAGDMIIIIRFIGEAELGTAVQDILLNRRLILPQLEINVLEKLVVLDLVHRLGPNSPLRIDD